MKILDIITEAPGTMTQAEIDAVVSNWKRQNPEAVAKLSATDPLTGAGPLGGKSAAAQKLLRTAIGIAPLVQLNLNLYALNQIAAQPLATFQQSNPKFASFTQEQKDAYIKQMRDMYYGIWSTQICIPVLTRWLARGTPVVSSLLEMIESYIGRIPGRLGGAVRLAVELAVPGFVLFLGTDQGIAWLSNSVFMPIIRMTGTGVAFTWDQLWPVIQKETGLPLDKVNPQTAVAVAADRAADFKGLNLMDPNEFVKHQNDQDQRMKQLKRF